MIDIGINYLCENEESYKILKKYNVINTLKYPGKRCTFEELEKFLVFTKNNGFKIDFHGIPCMKPAFCCDNKIVVESIDFDKLKSLFAINNEIYRISTHMGVDNKEKLTDYTEDELETNWNKNYKTLKSKMEYALGRAVEIGLENIPGEFFFDPETVTPEYINENWDKADFGVFDTAHALLSCKTLNMSYDEYLAKLQNTNKVKILHIAGDTNSTEQTRDKIDKHVMICQEEIDDLIKTINLFENLDLVDSEYVYNTKYSGMKETIIEAVVTKKMVETRDVEECKKIMTYLETNLEDDISNAEALLKDIL